MCVSALFACVCTKSQPKDYIIESAQNLTGEIPGWAQSIAHTGHPSFWWPRLLMLNFGFQEQALKQSCSAPPTLPVLTGSDSFNSFMGYDEPVLEMFLQTMSLTFKRIYIFILYFLITCNWLSQWVKYVYAYLVTVAYFGCECVCYLLWISYIYSVFHLGVTYMVDWR